MRLTTFAGRAAAVALLAAPLAAGAEGSWELGPVAVLPTEAAASAAVYHRYMRDVSTLNGNFGNARAVAAAVRRGAAYDPVQMQRGMIVYAAFVALQDQAFVGSVRDLEAQYGREALLRLLARDPDGVIRLPGAAEASATAMAALKTQGEAVLASGRSVKQASYDLQHQRWSLAPIPNAAGRLAEAKALGQTQVASQADADLLIKVVHSVPAQAVGGQVSVSPVVAKGLALAMLMTLGESLESPQAQALLQDSRSGSCLRMAKLNFHMCLSVAGPNYEDVYCLGQHALIDTGTCVAAAAQGR